MSKRDLLDEGMIVFQETEYDEAIIGTTEDGRAVYDYILLVEAVSKSQGLTDQEAAEWVDYNMIRSLPYLPQDRRPIVIDMMEGVAVDTERHGSWMIGEDELMECSECTRLFPYRPGLEQEWNYCPNCGARMDKAGDE